MVVVLEPREESGQREATPQPAQSDGADELTSHADGWVGSATVPAPLLGEYAETGQKPIVAIRHGRVQATVDQRYGAESPRMTINNINEQRMLGKP